MERTSTFGTAALPPAVRLGMLLAAWAIASFAFLRSPWLQATVILPFTEWQATIASWYLGTGALPIAMAPDCSGLDVIALCVGAIASYPASVRQRLIGAAGGFTVLLLLNIARIATLARAAALPGFGALHEYLWPALLTIAAVVYAGTWMWRIERPRALRAGPGTRFAVCAALFLIAYLVCVPLLADAGALDTYAGDAAATAVRVLDVLGVEASLRGRVLQVQQVSYLVTYECVTTPLLPLYLAAVITAPWRRRTRLAAAVAAFPLFIALSVVRLVTLAAPPLLFGSRLFLTHAFHQIALGGIAIAAAAVVAARVDPDWRVVARRTAGGIALALALGLLCGALYTSALTRVFPAALRDPSDIQGALLILPAFQLALFGALVFVLYRGPSPAPWLLGAGVLVAAQLALLGLAPSARAYASAETFAMLWRGWAVAAPVAAAAVLYRWTRCGSS